MGVRPIDDQATGPALARAEDVFSLVAHTCWLAAQAPTSIVQVRLAPLISMRLRSCLGACLDPGFKRAAGRRYASVGVSHIAVRCLVVSVRYQGQLLDRLIAFRCGPGKSRASPSSDLGSSKLILCMKDVAEVETQARRVGGRGVTVET
jgi:hypothetical protein